MGVVVLLCAIVAAQNLATMKVTRTEGCIGANEVSQLESLLWCRGDLCMMICICKSSS